MLTHSIQVDKYRCGHLTLIFEGTGTAEAVGKVAEYFLDYPLVEKAKAQQPNERQVYGNYDDVDNSHEVTITRISYSAQELTNAGS